MEVTIKKIKKEIPEKVAWRCSVKVFLKISQNWQENTCASFFFLKKVAQIY